MENLVKLKLDRLEEISLPSPAWRKKRSSPLSLNWFFEEEVGAKERKRVVWPCAWRDFLQLTQSRITAASSLMKEDICEHANSASGGVMVPTLQKR